MLENFIGQTVFIYTSQEETYYEDYRIVGVDQYGLFIQHDEEPDRIIFLPHQFITVIRLPAI